MAFTIINEWSKFNKKFQLRQHFVEFKLNEIDRPLEDVEQWIKDGMEDIYNLVTEALTADDKVGLTLSSDLLQHDVHAPMIDASDMSFDRLWELMHELYQSNTEATDGDTLTLIMTSFPGRNPAAAVVNTHGSGLDNLGNANEIPLQPSIQPSTLSSSILDIENATTSAPAGASGDDQASEIHNGKNAECRVCQCQLSEERGGRPELCERCYIKAGQCKEFIAYSSQSWNNYEQFKEWQAAYDKKKVRCTLCEQEMGRTAIYRHMARKHPDANP